MAEKTVPTLQNNQVQSTEGTREDTRYVIPPVDIYEKEDKLVVVVDLPGATRENINVGVEDNILTIQAKTSAETSKDAVYKEFEMVSFYRQFELSDRVDVDNISAEFQHGVMTLNLPKAPKALPRQIQVQVA